MKKKKIVDTTLRDGEQCPGIAFSEKEKIEIAAALDKIGVYEIEVGIPQMKVEGSDYIEKLKEHCKSSKLSLWSRMKAEDVEMAVACKPDILHIGAPVSYVQIYNKLKKNKSWVQKTIGECIEIAKDKGVQVTVGFEDASRADEGFMITLAKTVKNMGADTIRIADTVGILTPKRAGQIIKRIKNEVDINIEFHAHNDFGMAIANSIESAKSGSDLIDCTLMGIGERSGNCDLYKFLSSCDRIFDFGIDKKLVKVIENKFKNLLEV